MEAIVSFDGVEEMIAIRGEARRGEKVDGGCSGGSIDMRAQKDGRLSEAAREVEVGGGMKEKAAGRR